MTDHTSDPTPRPVDAAQLVRDMVQFVLDARYFLDRVDIDANGDATIDWTAVGSLQVAAESASERLAWIAAERLVSCVEVLG